MDGSEPRRRHAPGGAGRECDSRLAKSGACHTTDGRFQACRCEGGRPQEEQDQKHDEPKEDGGQAPRRHLPCGAKRTAPTKQKSARRRAKRCKVMVGCGPPSI